MTTETAFVGDIHGNLPALRGICRALHDRGVQHTVFLGDYINKGTQSAEVLTELISLADAGLATPLAGNHEHVLLQSLDSGNLAPFLKIGGAATVRSYVDGPVGPDVLADFRARLPRRHVAALREMPGTYRTDEVLATHVPGCTEDARFRISAHVYVGPVPRLDRLSAQIDTGCGEPSGRLTALLWPSREFVQVDNDGVTLPPPVGQSSI